MAAPEHQGCQALTPEGTEHCKGCRIPPELWRIAHTGSHPTPGVPCNEDSQLRVSQTSLSICQQAYASSGVHTKDPLAMPLCRFL